MSTRKARNEGFAVQRIAVERLHLDSENPRLEEAGGTNQLDLLRTLWRDMAVDEIALSIASNGYFDHEPLFAEKSGLSFVVIEGNRRLAAVKLLLSAELRAAVGATDLPSIRAAAAAKLHQLPVIVCSRAELWRYIGFKHVNGPQPWGSYSKAQYIAFVHNELGVPLDDIANHIGDQHSTVQRFYRAKMVLGQAEKAGVFSLDDRWKKHFSFSHLYTGLDYPGIQKFLKLSPRATRTKGLNPVPSSHIRQLGDLCVWLYGSKSGGKEPIISSQNPDLRLLDEVIQNQNGIAALRRGLPLRVSLNIGRGDDRLFREALVTAKHSLEEARGKLISGFRGEADLIDMANAIRRLAVSVADEMSAKSKPSRVGRGP